MHQKLLLPFIIVSPDDDEIITILNNNPHFILKYFQNPNLVKVKLLSPCDTMPDCSPPLGAADVTL